ncbi:MAG: hypothetical protein ACRDTJ_20375 [Pseudonocardiaceae bacterium]
MRRTPPYHVWVDVSARFGEHSQPGVLLAWRRAKVAPGRPPWECLVVHAVVPPPMNPDAMTLYQSWVMPHLVRPIDAELPRQGAARNQATREVPPRGSRAGRSRSA